MATDFLGRRCSLDGQNGTIRFQGNVPPTLGKLSYLYHTTAVCVSFIDNEICRKQLALTVKTIGLARPRPYTFSMFYY